jgi:transposase
MWRRAELPMAMWMSLLSFIKHRSEKELLPTEHLTDTNYAGAKQFLQSRHMYGIDVIAPTRADNTWQAKEKLGFDASSFSIDWQAHKATCPAGQESISWTPAIDTHSNEVIKIKFSSARL